MAEEQTEIARIDEAIDRLEGKLRIDKYALDDELEDQPRYFGEAAQFLADAISYRDDEKSGVDGTRALIDQELRQQAAEEAKKTTESGIANVVIGDPRYQRAIRRHAAWADRVNRLNGIKDAIQQRGYALKDLSSLYVAGYWTGNIANSSEGRGQRTAHAERIKEQAATERAEKPPRRREKLDD